MSLGSLHRALEVVGFIHGHSRAFGVIGYIRGRLFHSGALRVSLGSSGDFRLARARPGSRWVYPASLG